ncbi:MAG: phosphonate metabolism transcriptional regulator PhnF, partial [Pseudomonadota bacterium]
MPKPSKKRDKLDTRSGVALWRQIADRLRTELTFLADDKGRLPPEPALAGRFQVNRLTLRAAVTALVEEGQLSREQGRGTFIKKQKRLRYPITRRTRFSEGLAKQAEERMLKVLEDKIEPADDTVSNALELPLATPVVRLETLSLADRVPIFRSSHWFPAARFQGIGEIVTETGSITQALVRLGVG